MLHGLYHTDGCKVVLPEEQDRWYAYRQVFHILAPKSSGSFLGGGDLQNTSKLLRECSKKNLLKCLLADPVSYFNWQVYRLICRDDFYGDVEKGWQIWSTINANPAHWHLILFNSLDLH